LTRPRILVTGRDGQLGRELELALGPLGELHVLSRAEMDLSEPDSIRNVTRSLRPNLIVNAAAYTAVDRAEQKPETAMRVNAHAVEVLASEAKQIGAAVIHYSTDYVFDGQKHESYFEDDPTNPINVYGRSKLAGEQALAASGVPHMIFRTSWVYASHGKNFLLTMLRLAEERSKSGAPLKIVADQFGAPTPAREIAHATHTIIAQLANSTDTLNERIARNTGIFHMTSQGKTTWYSFAEAIIRNSPHSQVTVLPIPASEYPTPAARPQNSLLNCDKLARSFKENEAALALPPWEQGLRRTLDELQKTGK
jgi:dTDP-4-dehydrorhamnose reductase